MFPVLFYSYSATRPMPHRSVSIRLNDEEVEARHSGALWHGATRTLIVSDLHLGKSERNARRGGTLWPPYENGETLARLEAEIAATSPSTIVTLGDSFDDNACVEGLDSPTRSKITQLIEAHRWIWVTGNHDPNPVGLSGEGAEAYALGALTLHHMAQPETQGEVSGHYHPKASLRLRGQRISRKCFVLDKNRIVLPAFGAFTGGLDIFHEAFAPLIGSDGQVILTGEHATAIPLSDLRRMAA